MNRTVLIVAMLGACCARPLPVAPKPKEPVPVVVETIHRGCLRFTARPRPLQPFTAVTGAASAPHFACYAEPDAVALAWYLEELERAIDGALIDCAPMSAPEGLPP